MAWPAWKHSGVNKTPCKISGNIDRWISTCILRHIPGIQNLSPWQYSQRLYSAIYIEVKKVTFKYKWHYLCWLVLPMRIFVMFIAPKSLFVQSGFPWMNCMGNADKYKVCLEDEFTKTWLGFFWKAKCIAISKISNINIATSKILSQFNFLGFIADHLMVPKLRWIYKVIALKTVICVGKFADFLYFALRHRIFEANTGLLTGHREKPRVKKVGP